jgi:acylglycerol lipase
MALSCLWRVVHFFLGVLVVGGCAVTPTIKPNTGQGQAAQLLADRVITSDGTALGLQRWMPQGDLKGVILGVHGMSEYADAFYTAGPYWAARGVAVYAYDQRGFGRSTQRGLWAGTSVMARDVRDIAALIRANHPDVPFAVVGESMGGASVINAFDGQEEVAVDAIILSAPALRGWSTLPITYRWSLGLTARLFGGASVAPPRRLLRIQASDNIEALRKNGADPLYLNETRFDTLHGLVGHMESASKASLPARVPVLLLFGQNDQIIPRAPVLAFWRRLGPCVLSADYPTGWHMLFRDLSADLVRDDVLSFLKDPYRPLPSRALDLDGRASSSILREACSH